MYVHFFLGVNRSRYPKNLCDNFVIQDVKIFNNQVKLDHSKEFASVLKVLGRVGGTLFIQMYLKSNKKIKRTRAKSQFALKVYFIKSIILDIAWDLCDFHKLLGCYVNLIYRNLVNFQLQEQVHNCRKSLKLEKLTDETGTDVMRFVQ